MNPTVERMYDFWRQWFAQPDAAKEAYRRKRDPVTGKGTGNWYPPFSEAPGYGKPDPKEYFHFKPADFAMDEATATVFGACYEAARSWLVARGLSELTFPEELCVLRILHYLPTPDGLVGEAHRDFDLLTVSVEGTCPGLEVAGEAHEDVPGVGSFATRWWYSQEEGVQVGEMLEIYAAAQQPPRLALPATLHRVRTAPNTERFKAVFFYLPPMDFQLRPGFTAHDYLLGPEGVLVKAGAKR